MGDADDGGHGPGGRSVDRWLGRCVQGLVAPSLSSPWAHRSQPSQAPGKCQGEEGGKDAPDDVLVVGVRVLRQVALDQLPRVLRVELEEHEHLLVGLWNGLDWVGVSQWFEIEWPVCPRIRSARRGGERHHRQGGRQAGRQSGESSQVGGKKKRRKQARHRQAGSPEIQRAEGKQGGAAKRRRVGKRALSM